MRSERAPARGVCFRALGLLCVLGACADAVEGELDAALGADGSARELDAAPRNQLDAARMDDDPMRSRRTDAEASAPSLLTDAQVDAAEQDAASPDAGHADAAAWQPSTLEELPYAQAVVSYMPGEHAGFGQGEYPEIVLGPPLGGGELMGSLDVLSLGVGGSIVLGFGDYDVIDGPGIDLVVFENAFFAGGDLTQPFVDLGEVALSEDGEHWQRFECAPSGDGCAGKEPVFSYDPLVDFPIDPELSGGDGFDLQELGLERARYVRIEDRATEGEGNNAGFDLDAIGLVHFVRAER